MRKYTRKNTLSLSLAALFTGELRHPVMPTRIEAANRTSVLVVHKVTRAQKRRAEQVAANKAKAGA